jgi:hypothetical protein
MRIVYQGMLALPPPTLEMIERLERENFKLPQVECPIVHTFAPGVGTRQMTIPAGVGLTGAVHKTEHINVLAKGRITVWTEEGMKTLKAPFQFVSKPGTKRVGYAHEECVWITIHHTEAKTIREFVAELTDEPFENLLDVRMATALEATGRKELACH